MPGGAMALGFPGAPLRPPPSSGPTAPSTRAACRPNSWSASSVTGGPLDSGRQLVDLTLRLIDQRHEAEPVTVDARRAGRAAAHRRGHPAVREPHARHRVPPPVRRARAGPAEAEGWVYRESPDRRLERSGGPHRSRVHQPTGPPRDEVALL